MLRLPNLFTKQKYFQLILALFPLAGPVRSRISTRNSSANAECRLLLASEMKNVNMRHGCRKNVENLNHHYLSYTVAVVIP
jgi:hypothetical protein